VAVHALPDTPLAREASRVAFDTAPVAAVTIALPVVAPHHERIASPETLARPPPLIPFYLAHHAFLC
jgi:hypothetical protein